MQHNYANNVFNNMVSFLFRKTANVIKVQLVSGTQGY